MESSAPLWLFPLIAAPGLWLAGRLYLRAVPPRRGLAVASAAAWLLLGFWVAGPRLGLRPETWHPPLVVLAADESPSYAALGARDSAARAIAAARRHYEGLGFRVAEAGFAERVVEGGAARDADAGTLTRPSVLRRHLNAAAFPNLQAVLLWTDGRFFEDAEETEGMAGEWPAPVFPVVVSASGGEAQGEGAEADFAAPGGAVLTVSWRAIGAPGGRATDAVIEIRDGEKILWTERLPHPPDADAGDVVSARLPLPPRLSGAADPESWTLLLRPAAADANATVKNDTVPFRARGRNRPLHLLIRPLAALEERGLLDALRDPDGRGAIAVSPDSLRAGREDVVWVNARHRAPASVRAAAAPVVAYRLFGAAQAAEGNNAFGPDARLAWRPDGAGFMPAGALRLGDLGAEALALRAPDSSVEALAWAEQDGRRGLLFWRERAGETFGLAVPPLWRAAFRPGGRGEAGGSGAAALWVRGAGEWARARGATRVEVPEPLLAGRRFSVSARVPSGDGGRAAARHEFVHPFGARAASPGSAILRFDSLALPAGRHAASLRRGGAADGETAWRGVLRVRDPLDAELARLGTDADALRRLAARAGGSTINISNNDYDKYSAWPALPGGQARELRFRALSLAPPLALSLILPLLLGAVWAVRKRLRLD